jgi:hypothetical protein
MRFAAERDTMICQIYPVSADGSRFEWKWRCTDGKQESTRSFAFFYDCVEDARRHGVDVDLAQAHREIAGATLNVRIVAEGAQEPRAPLHTEE